MMSSTRAPRLRSFTGLARPCSIGPMLTTRALRCTALYVDAPLGAGSRARATPSSTSSSGPGGQLGSPVAGPVLLLRLEPVLLGHQEALRLRDHIEAVLAQQVVHSLGGPAGQRRGPVHPGVEGGRPDPVVAERVEPLTQPGAQRVRLDLQAADR